VLAQGAVSICSLDDFSKMRSFNYPRVQKAWYILGVHQCRELGEVSCGLLELLGKGVGECGALQRLVDFRGLFIRRKSQKKRSRSLGEGTNPGEFLFFLKPLGGLHLSVERRMISLFLRRVRPA